jgi:hypothetical protein
MRTGVIFNNLGIAFNLHLQMCVINKSLFAFRRLLLTEILYLETYVRKYALDNVNLNAVIMQNH